MTSLLTLTIRYEQDVVLVRQRARQIAELLGFEAQDQTRIATAVSEAARDAFLSAAEGRVVFEVAPTSPPVLLIRLHSHAVAWVNPNAELLSPSSSDQGAGINGSRRLMDQFQIESSAQGTTVVMGKQFAAQAPAWTEDRRRQIIHELAQRSPQSPFEAVQQQNQELLQALEELRKREEELTYLNRELEDTNRGVVALYAELDEKADSLRRANELKTRFLSNMSHEFRTPLNSILSLSRLLLDRCDGDLTGEQEKQVTFIRKAAEGLSDLVNDLLDLAKVEAGKTQVHPAQFEVSELFATLRGMLRPLLTHNSVNLVFEEPNDIPTLVTDEGKVAQILRNFVANALKYTEQGEVRVSARRQGDMVVLAVADTGIGIDPANQERIFEDFVQIDSSLQRRVKGTGLGLPLSRKLAELLGGSVSVSSEVGVGSTFSAYIPIVYPGASIVPAPVAPPIWQLDTHKLPILVIEDNEETLFTYEKYLEGTSYQVIPARTLEQAQQVLATLKPKAILLDILLAGQSSWMFLSDLSQQADTQTIPVIVITVVDNEKQAIARGAAAFLIKPVDRLLLLNRLNTLVRRDQRDVILLIDDDPVARYLLKQYLSGLPFSVLEAGDGAEGVRLAQVERPHVIILDLVLPDCSGVEVLNQLKSHFITSSIPVIINTSQPAAADAVPNLASQVITVLSKENRSKEVAIDNLHHALRQAGIHWEAKGTINE